MDSKKIVGDKKKLELSRETIRNLRVQSSVRAGGSFWCPVAGSAARGDCMV